MNAKLRKLLNRPSEEITGNKIEKKKTKKNKQRERKGDILFADRSNVDSYKRRWIGAEVGGKIQNIAQENKGEKDKLRKRHRERERDAGMKREWGN